jgi:hypothetical protein
MKKQILENLPVLILVLAIIFETAMPAVVWGDTEASESALPPPTISENIEERNSVEDILTEEELPASTEVAGNNDESPSTNELSEEENNEVTVSLPSPDNVATTTISVGEESPITSPDESATTTPSDTLPVLSSTLGGEAGLNIFSTTTPAEMSATGTPTIVSGEAVALANILNLVNTNFVNSNGVILFSNFYDLVQSTLDLRGGSSSLFDGACGLLNCTGNQVSVNVSNDAHIENSILLNASSGENVIGGGATSTITTGNAYAGLNLVNVANTNFVDSNYLLVTLNAFEGVQGDIVFPSLSNFFSNLASSASSPVDIDLTNNGNLQNNANIISNSGGNTVNASGGGIESGDAYSSSNVFNQLNSNLIGGANISILFRVHGSWAGEIFGAPSNLAWTESPDGGVYLFDIESGSGTTSNGVASSVNINGVNNTLIHNDVSVIALTGENEISGAGTGLISTGNAYAGANIVNIANSNIVGRNWIMAVINIFGDFEGNIAFGRPDLWVGEQVTTPSDVTNGSLLTYKFTVLNNGDSPASATRLVDSFDRSHIEIVDSTLQYSENENGHLVWDLGNLPPGKGTEVSYRARIVNSSPDTEITNIVTVSAHETDNNTLDNTDTASVRTMKSSSGGRTRSTPRGEVLGEMLTNLNLSINRTNSDVILYRDKMMMTQELVIKNTNNLEAKSVVLHDTLRNPNGDLIHEEVWDFGDILPNEEITVTYDLNFSDSAQAGTYILSTVVWGVNVPKSDYIANGFISLRENDTTSEETAVAEENQVVPSVTSLIESLGIEEAEAAESVDATSTPDDTSSIMFFVGILGVFVTRVILGIKEILM